MDSTKLQKFSTTLNALLSNLSKTGRSWKQAITVFVDTVVVAIALWFAYSLRLGMPFSDFESTWYLFLCLPIATVVIFMSLGIYRWVIRSSNVNLFRQLVKACIISSLFLVVFTFLIPPDRINPRSLFVIYGLLLVTGTSGVRMFWQALFDAGSKGEPVAIYGAGDAGQQLYSSLTQGNEFKPVLFLEDNQSSQRTTIAGLPCVWVDSTDLTTILSGMEVEKVILAMPAIGASEYHEKLNKIKSSGVPVLTVPTQTELISGAATLGEVRDISIDDILGRTEVSPNPELLGRCITGQNVLVTGGGGSIGSELSRQILLQRPKKLVILDHSEFNLYNITEELNSQLVAFGPYSPEFKPKLGSVVRKEEMLNLLLAEEIDTVYHAAAYKHVPVIEEQPEQGLVTNVFGTLRLLDSAIEAKVKNFVLISTDKAVRPTNSMGATKRVAELILQAKSNLQSDTKISMVRFGNVLGSSGSVVPKFKKQIDQNGPITLTHPDVTRFFMTIPEAAQLVMQASSIAVGGDVFVLDMGEPVRIEDLAVSMVRLSGKKLQRNTGKESDIEIVVEGLRPGEKMYEELFITNSHCPTVVPKVFTAKEVWIPWNELKFELDKLARMGGAKNAEKLRKHLLRTAFTGLSQEKPDVNNGSREKHIEALAEV